MKPGLVWAVFAVACAAIAYFTTSNWGARLFVFLILFGLTSVWVAHQAAKRPPDN